MASKRPNFRDLADTAADVATIVVLSLVLSVALAYPILRSLLAG